MIAFFHLQWLWKSLLYLHVCAGWCEQIGFETDDIRDMTIHSNAKMFPLTNASPPVRRQKTILLHFMNIFHSFFIPPMKISVWEHIVIDKCK